MAGLLADCHVHFEGTLPEEALQRLAARAGHAFANLEVFRERCRGMGDGAGFLSLYADVCRLFRTNRVFAPNCRFTGLSDTHGTGAPGRVGCCGLVGDCLGGCLAGCVHDGVCGCQGCPVVGGSVVVG